MKHYETIKVIEEICKEYCTTERIAEHCASAIYCELESRDAIKIEEEED